MLWLDVWLFGVGETAGVVVVFLGSGWEPEVSMLAS